MGERQCTSGGGGCEHGRGCLNEAGIIKHVVSIGVRKIRNAKQSWHVVAIAHSARITVYTRLSSLYTGILQVAACSNQ